MDRREWLKWTTALPLASACGRLYAAPNARGKLLVVFLRGGYDAANLLVPVGSQFYYDSRPGIAVARPGADANTALPLDAHWGLHPALRETLWPLYRQGQLAFVPFCGTEDLTRSHFETQDSVELGQPVNVSRDYQSGFLNRLVVELEGGHAIAFTDDLPIVLRGERDVPNMALRSLPKPGVDERESVIIASMYQRTSLKAQVDEGFGLRSQVLHSISEEMDAASRNAITAKGFELEAQRIGRMMVDRFDIGFVDVGGWDTHVGQGGATGYLAGRFSELGRGLAAVATTMGPLWKDTVVVVVSEFGRTFRENGNHGTDHGHGSVYWVLGGGIRGGRVVGDQVALTAATLFQNRDYPVLNDYRDVLGGLFAKTYGLSPARLDKVFPGARPRDIGLV